MIVIPHKKNIILIVLLSILWIASATAQSQQDIQLAQEYLKNDDYDKAASLYDKLLSKNPANSIYYQNSLLCLTSLKRYDDAEKMIRKQIKRYPQDLTYYVDLGNVLSQ